MADLAKLQRLVQRLRALAGKDAAKPSAELHKTARALPEAAPADLRESPQLWR